MRKLDSISRRIATGFTKFDGFFKAFLRVGNVWSESRVVQSREFVEFYLDCE